MRSRAGIVALALLVVSCGGGGSSGGTTGSGGPAATPAPSPSATVPVGEGSYATVREMQLDVEAAFYLCNSPMKIYDPPTIEGALAQADCSMDVALLIFEPDGIQAGAAAVQAAAEGALTYIVGNNWIISCSSNEAACNKIQGVTGGELITS